MRIQANSGFYVGHYSALRPLFTHMTSLLSHVSLWDDQGLLTFEYYMNNVNGQSPSRFNMTFDYASSIIYTIAFAGAEFGVRTLEDVPGRQDYVKGVKDQLNGVKGLAKRWELNDALPLFDSEDNFHPNLILALNATPTSTTTSRTAHPPPSTLMARTSIRRLSGRGGGCIGRRGGRRGGQRGGI